MLRHEKGWDRIYHRYSPESLPWELGRPRSILVEMVESGQVTPSRALDLCCGAGTNLIYLAKKGFDVTALDVSDKAVEYSRKNAHEAKVEMNLVVGDFLYLPFRSKEFGFIFDFGCFHHVEVENRIDFINGVFRVLKSSGRYCLVCFSYRNGSAWNHFRKEQIVDLFGDYFEWTRHVSSVESDGVTRYFYEFLMRNRS